MCVECEKEAKERKKTEHLNKRCPGCAGNAGRFVRQGCMNRDRWIPCDRCGGKGFIVDYKEIEETTNIICDDVFGGTDDS